MQFDMLKWILNQNINIKNTKSANFMILLITALDAICCQAF
jgi:hypothetical protein